MAGGLASFARGRWMLVQAHTVGSQQIISALPLDGLALCSCFCFVLCSSSFLFLFLFVCCAVNYFSQGGRGGRTLNVVDGLDCTLFI